MSVPRRTVTDMLTSIELAARSHYAVYAVACGGEHRGWSEPESPSDHRLVLVRHGQFQRRGSAGTADVDRHCAYLVSPQEQECFAHPSGGDVCTSITVRAPLWRALAGAEAVPAAPCVPVDGRLDLAHRRCLTAARAGDPDYALAEELIGLLTAAVRRTVPGPIPDEAGRRDHRLVAAARSAILDGHPAAGGLVPLSELLVVSPFRLSRAFSREMGESITRYRNRIRVARALDALERGQRSLAALATDLGYADQAHLTRTLRAHVGHTPSAVRALLRSRG
jgi:AraC-like DNA-binding protein